MAQRPSLRLPRAGRSSIRLTVVVATLASGAACQGGGSEQGLDVDVVRAISLASRSGWDVGRAVGALATPEGELVIATTGGIFLTPDTTRPAVEDRKFTTASDTQFALSPDGRRVAVAGGTELPMTVLDTATSAVVSEFELPAGMPVRRIRWIDEHRILIETPAGPLLADSAAPGEMTAVLDGEGSERSALLADGTVVTAERRTNQLMIVRDGVLEARDVGISPDHTILGVDASPDGSTIAVISGVGTDVFDRSDRVTLLDGSTFGSLGVIEPEIAVAAAQWILTDGALAVAWDGGVRMWRFDGSSVDIEVPVDADIDSIVPLGAGALTVHRDGTLIAWQPDGSKATAVRTGSQVVSISPGPDGSSFVVVDRFGEVTMHRSRDGETLLEEDAFASGNLTALGSGADGSFAVTSTVGDVLLFDENLEARTTIPVTAAHMDLSALSVNPTTGAIAAGVAERVGLTAFDDTVFALDTSGDVAFRIGGEREDVAGCGLFVGRVRHSPDGRLLAVASHDFGIAVVDSTTGDEVARLDGETTILDLAFSPSGERLLATYDDGMVLTWSVDGFDRRSSFRGVQGGYTAVAFVDEQHIAAASLTGAIAVLDVDDGDLVSSMAGASTRTSTIAASSDGAMVVAPDGDGAVSVWSTATGSLLTTVRGHVEPVTGVAFSDDASVLVTASLDGTVQAWSVRTSV